MKLFFYSKLEPSIHLDSFHLMNEHLKNQIKSTNPRVGFIASQYDSNKYYYNKTKTFYSRLGIKNVFEFDLEVDFNSNKLDDLFTSDIIHLSSGNTYRFLNNLKLRNLLTPLNDYIKKGGILVGISAGCHIMCDDITLAKYGDINEINLLDLKALNLVRFKVIPHWNRKVEYIDLIVSDSTVLDKTIYLLEDGQGIYVHDQDVTLYGNIKKVIPKNK